MKYRAEIDGLRALAIIGVLIYHAFPQFLPGGYSGVDIFFIISGYLIGSTIFMEFENNKFSFLSFYQRRIIRILPLLLFVLFATFLLGYYYLLPFEFKSLGRHLSATSVFGSNLLLIKEVGYFNTAADLKPLLHLWSLGIEEQFYIVLPLLIVLFGRNQLRSKILLSLCILLSFGFCLHLSGQDITKSFFNPGARIWELLIGVLLTKIETIPSFEFFKYKKHLSIFGFFFCIFGYVFLNSLTIYPGFPTLIPVAGACLLIYSGKESFINKKILSRTPFVFIGKISYSLYLWHWIFLSFNQIIYYQHPNSLATISAILFSIFLSILTFNFIEKPLRNISPLPKKALTIFSLLGLIIFYNLGRQIYKLQFVQSHFDENVKKIAMQALDSNDMQGTTMLPFANWHYYKRGAGPKIVVILGDSHIGMYYSRINDLVKKDDPFRTLYFFTMPGCLPITNLSYKNYGKKNCDDYYLKAYEFGIKNKASELIIASNWLPHMAGEMDSFYSQNKKKYLFSVGSFAYQAALDNLDFHLKSYTRINAKIYFLSSIPFGPEFNPNKMFKRNYGLTPFQIKITPFSLLEFNKKYLQIINDLKTVAKKNNSVIIDPIDYLCNLKYCPTVDSQEIPLYSDDNHLRKSYAKDKITYIDFIFKN